MRYFVFSTITMLLFFGLFFSDWDDYNRTPKWINLQWTECTSKLCSQKWNWICRAVSNDATNPGAITSAYESILWYHSFLYDSDSIAFLDYNINLVAVECCIFVTLGFQCMKLLYHTTLTNLLICWKGDAVIHKLCHFMITLSVTLRLHTQFHFLH